MWDSALLPSIAPDPSTAGLDADQLAIVQSGGGPEAGDQEWQLDDEEDPPVPPPAGPPGDDGEPGGGHGRGDEKRKVVIEATGVRRRPSDYLLRYHYHFHVDLQEHWRQPPADAVAGGRAGHTGGYGPILRSVALHDRWQQVCRAARKAILRQWLRWEASGQGRGPPPEVRICVSCHSGRHRSVAAAYLLAGLAEAMRPRCEARVQCLQCHPCGCPNDCPLLASTAEEVARDAAHDVAASWTYQILQALEREGAMG